MVNPYKARVHGVMADFISTWHELHVRHLAAVITDRVITDRVTVIGSL